MTQDHDCEAILLFLKTRFEPNVAHHRRYRHIYPIFRDIYENRRATFDRAAELPSD